MDAGGYITPSDANPFPEQPAAAVNAIRLSMGLGPALLLGAAICFALLYPLGRADQWRAREAILTRGGQ
jgi:Na+/melibiose symporter-like transporter